MLSLDAHCKKGGSLQKVVFLCREKFIMQSQIYEMYLAQLHEDVDDAQEVGGS